MRDAIRCPICEQPWNFATDGLGRLVVQHSILPCVPKPVKHLVECSVCEKEITLEGEPSYRQRTFWCSETCRLILREKRKQSVRYYAKKSKKAQERLKRIYRRVA